MVSNVKNIVKSNYTKDEKFDKIDKLFSLASVYEFDKDRVCEIFYGDDHDYFEGKPSKELYIEIVEGVPVKVYTCKPETMINMMKYQYDHDYKFIRRFRNYAKQCNYFQLHLLILYCCSVHSASIKDTHT